MLNWSIERKLPVFVTALLVAVTILLMSIGYGEVRRAARGLASERLQRGTRELATLFERSTTQQRTQVSGLAKDTAVVAFLASGGRRGREQAVAALARVTRDTASNAAIELYDPAGRLLLRVGRLAVAREPFGESADSAFIGPLLQRDTTLFYQVGLAVHQRGRDLGRVQQVVRLNLSERARATLTGLAGGDVLLLLGNAAGDPWTDFARAIPPPPESVRGSAVPIRYDRDGESRHGGAASIGGTPWMVIAELPSRVVLRPADAYRRRMIPFAALVVLIGALGAWWASRRWTRPLADVTRAAEAIARGDFSHPVPVRRGDEIGRLARSFNTMAEKVATSYHTLEEQVAERTRALEGTNAELESFSYSVSHDLRAPLRAIHGFARILLDDHREQLDPEAQRLLGVIDQNTRRMGQLIDDLLSFSRLGRKGLETARVDMRDLARNVADEVRRSEGERELEITIDALPPARGDRALLRQVVSNLVSNAAKFTRGRPDSRIEVGYQPNGAEATYYVKDNGAGFDDRYADKLFGVFQRLHSTEEFEGTGVGLAIVKRIVQRHGGRVWAESKLNEGATFYFTLPLSEE